MNINELLAEIYNIDKTLVISKQKYAAKSDLYEFKAKQIIKIRNSFMREFEEIQNVNKLKMLVYPLSLSFSASEDSLFPSFDMVQKKINSLFSTIKKIGTDINNLYLTDFSYGSTIICLDFIKDKSKDIDSINDFMQLTSASVKNEYSDSLIENLVVNKEMKPLEYFNNAIKMTPTKRSHIEMIKIASSIDSDIQPIEMITETRKLYTEYIMNKTPEIPAIVSGYIREIDDYHKSFELYKSMEDDSDFITRIYFSEFSEDTIKNFAEKNVVRISIMKDKGKYYYKNFIQ